MGFFSKINKYAYNTKWTPKMLHIIRDITDSLIELIKDDPVRPELSKEFRVNENSQIFVLMDEDQREPMAVTCVKFIGKIPQNVDDLADLAITSNTAVFYTIWSYAAGAGRTLIEQAQEEIRRQHPEIDTYVTLSPKTEMARRFHLKNGAEVYRENPETVNYLYR